MLVYELSEGIYGCVVGSDNGGQGNAIIEIYSLEWFRLNHKHVLWFNIKFKLEWKLFPYVYHCSMVVSFYKMPCSLENQTYKDFTLYISDDGSIDDLSRFGGFPKNNIVWFKAI